MQDTAGESFLRGISADSEFRSVVNRREDGDAMEPYFRRHEQLILALQEDKEDEESHVLDEIINLCLECHNETAMSAEETAARRRQRKYAD